MTGRDFSNKAAIIISNRCSDKANRLPLLYIFCLSIKNPFFTISCQIGIQINCQRKSFHSLGGIKALKHKDRCRYISKPKGRAGMNSAEWV